MDISSYCREIETYLCRKNDGHLIRVVGPSFDRVSSWAARGVPIKIAFEGIDRYFERYYRQGPRRRPVKIDFCEADVLDAFDEWRRATGIVASAAVSHESPNHESQIPNPKSRQLSLPAHLERVLTRLTSIRAGGTLDDSFDALLDRVAAELDEARSKSSGLRGAARAALVARLAQIEEELVRAVRESIDEHTLAELRREADEELAPFRSGMTSDTYERAHAAAMSRLIRNRFGVPSIAFF